MRIHSAMLLFVPVVLNQIIIDRHTPSCLIRRSATVPGWLRRHSQGSPFVLRPSMLLTLHRLCTADVQPDMTPGLYRNRQVRACHERANATSATPAPPSSWDLDQLCAILLCELGTRGCTPLAPVLSVFNVLWHVLRGRPLR